MQTLLGNAQLLLHKLSNSLQGDIPRYEDDERTLLNILCFLNVLTNVLAHLAHINVRHGTTRGKTIASNNYRFPKTARTGMRSQQEVIYTEWMTYVKNSLFKFKIYEARRDAAFDLRKFSNSMVNKDFPKPFPTSFPALFQSLAVVTFLGFYARIHISFQLDL